MLKRVLIADDQELIRKQVRAILTARLDLEVCAEAADGQEAVEMAGEFRPDLIILDITMPRLNGLEAARKIRQFAPDTPILILSVHKSRQLTDEAQKIGAMGFVTKADAGQDLNTAVDAVLANRPYFPAEA